MARIQGVVKGGSLLVRGAFWMTRRAVGHVVRPVRVHALYPNVFLAYGMMEKAQTKKGVLPPEVKALAEVLVAMRIGCPF